MEYFSCFIQVFVFMFTYKLVPDINLSIVTTSYFVIISSETITVNDIIRNNFGNVNTFL